MVEFRTKGKGKDRVVYPIRSRTPYGENKDLAKEQVEKLRSEGVRSRLIETNWRRKLYAPYVSALDPENVKKAINPESPKNNVNENKEQNEKPNEEQKQPEVVQEKPEAKETNSSSGESSGSSNSDEKIDVSFATWGSFGQHNLDVAILKGFKAVDPRYLPHPYKKYGPTKEADVNGVRITTENLSSHKNAHFRASIPKKDVLVVYHETRTSGRLLPEVKIIDPSVESAEIVEKEEKRLKEAKENKNIYNIYRVRYVKVKLKDGTEKEIPVAEDYARSETEMTGKPKLVIGKNGKAVTISGDTYYVKEKLKELHAKWSPFDNWWVIYDSDPKQIAEQLKDIANVSINEK